MTRDSDDYHYEAEMAGFYAGGVLGGLFFGALGDLLRTQLHTMAWYIGGTLLGAVAGTTAAFLFRRFSPQESVEPRP
jgi:hypothetical protein